MRHIPLVATLLLLAVLPLQAEDWPAWRGPTANGYSRDTGFPLNWSASENIEWVAKLPGPGNATPIIVGNRVFVSCASRNGHRRTLLCLNRKDGTMLWRHDVDYAQEESTHVANPYCSSSPVSDGQRVVVWHGSAGLFAYDLDGARLWQEDLGRFKHIWGSASSPVIYQDLVVLNCGPGVHSFMLAVDKRTGTQRWRRQLPGMASQKPDDYVGSWSTPLVVSHGDTDSLLVSLPTKLFALDPLTGQPQWSCAGLGKLVYTSPICGDSPHSVPTSSTGPSGSVLADSVANRSVAGSAEAIADRVETASVVVAMSGNHGPTLAVSLGGQGDVTATRRLWLHAEKTPQRIGSGIVVDDCVYVLNEQGIAWCMELATGDILWKHRLGVATSWSSMCYADQRIYVNDSHGTTFVLKPDMTECLVLAQNPIKKRMGASLAFSEGQIFIRTYDNLYCVEQRPAKKPAAAGPERPPTARPRISRVLNGRANSDEAP